MSNAYGTIQLSGVRVLDVQELPTKNGNRFVVARFYDDTLGLVFKLAAFSDSDIAMMRNLAGVSPSQKINLVLVLGADFRDNATIKVESFNVI